MDRAIPAEPQPGKILLDQGVILCPAAFEVGILHPQKKLPARRARHVMRKDRGIGVAEVQRTGGAGREAGYESHSVNACFARSV